MNNDLVAIGHDCFHLVVSSITKTRAKMQLIPPASGDTSNNTCLSGFPRVNSDLININEELKHCPFIMQYYTHPRGISSGAVLLNNLILLQPLEIPLKPPNQLH